MSDLNKDLEGLVGDMGLSVSDSMPDNLETTAEQSQEAPAESAPETVQEPVQEVQQTQETTQTEQEEAAVEEPQSSLQEEEEFSEEELEATMLDYLSERLGRQVSSIDELSENTTDTSVEIDERVEAINRFVKETGRGVEDWIAYQSMNTSEMDDLSVIKMQLKSQYGNAASNEDLDLLIQNKYTLDEDVYDESEIRLATLQLKVDADKARQEIESLRDSYKTPVPAPQTSTEEPVEGIVTEEWINDMSAEVDALDGIEFQLAKDKSFTFGLNDSYKSQLKSKNEGIEDFFSSYVSDNGQWDFERWNMHQAVIDNIETILKTAYQQGLGDGQRGLVDKAANVQYEQPNQVGNTGQSNAPSVEEQVRQALGLNDNGLTFKI
tara:strand:+ start:314 stop:1453 length:1140 start_codon:yes stop_codon:yes gene_type:complete